MTAETPWPVLRRDSKGPEVTTLQYLLRGAREAWRTLQADGVFGRLTEEAVRGFQDIAGVTVDGVVGSVTWGKLTDGVTLASSVRSGSHGEFVKAAQTELIKHKLLSADQEDGIFGSRTDSATRGFQKRVGLTADGIVGPLTWRQLISRNPD